MKYAFILSLLLVLTSPIFGQSYEKYYQNLPIELKQVTAPTFSDASVNIKDFGAIGDGQTLCTDAIQKAINTLAKKGGGTVVVPAGIWLIAPIQLKSGINLHLEKNAVLQLTEVRSMHVKDGAKKANSAITASKAHDIAITGQGTIDGNGEFWRGVKRGKQSDVEWKMYTDMGGTVNEKGDLWFPWNLKHQENIAENMDDQEKMRVNMVRFTDCERVLVEGVTLQNAPKFHLTPSDCVDVIIDGVTVRCPWNAQNGDAIDIGTCQRVLIVNNVIDCGDDGICMKGAVGEDAVNHGPCEDILIADNTVYHAHGGFVIGSEFSAGMKKIVVRDNLFSGTDVGLRFKSAIGRGGKTEQIYCYNIMMTDIKDQAITFETTYSDVAVGGATFVPGTGVKWVPEFQDINIYDIVCNGCTTGVRAKGAKGMIHDIRIKNATIFYNKNATEIDEVCDVKMDNVKLVTYTK